MGRTGAKVVNFSSSLIRRTIYDVYVFWASSFGPLWLYTIQRLISYDVWRHGGCGRDAEGVVFASSR